MKRVSHHLSHLVMQGLFPGYNGQKNKEEAFRRFDQRFLRVDKGNYPLVIGVNTVARG